MLLVNSQQSIEKDVMQITSQLFQPLLERIELEYRELLDEVSDLDTDETVELKTFVQKKLRQLDMVRVSLAYMQQESSGDFSNDPFDLRETLRQHKLELRFARRRWKRQRVSQERIRRNHERRNHVPTFAA